MNAKTVITAAATAAVAIFGAQVVHQLAGSKAGAVGMGIKLAAGTAGVLLVSKLR